MEYTHTTEIASPLERANGELDDFVYNTGLEDMMDIFGSHELPHDRTERLQNLQAFAAAHWDFRKGSERQTIDWSDDRLDDPESYQWQSIFAAADKLTMVHDITPTNKRPDSLVILGGANRAPLDRLRFGLEQTQEAGQIVYLGSSRAVSEAEASKAADYAPNAQTEFDLGCGAVETVLAARVVDEVTIERNGDTWRMRYYEYEKDGKAMQAFALSTPQTIGAKRATTYDNYKFFADAAELATNPDHTIVAVTTGFYTNAQHLAAVQELTALYGTQVETIGHSAEYSGVVRKPRQLLQETKAAIDAAVRLNEYVRQAPQASHGMLAD